MVNLSLLPPPDLVETIDYESIVDRKHSEFKEAYPEHAELLESDPATYLIETAAYDEMDLRQRINDASRRVMLAFATGTDLEHLGAPFGVTRLDEESDDAFRTRIQESVDGYSAGGHEAAYRYLAKSVSSHVIDIATTRPIPGSTIVYVLTDGTEGIIDEVKSTLLEKDKKQLCANVTVQPAETKAFSVSYKLTLYAGPSETPIVQAVKKSIETLSDKKRALGESIPTSALDAAAYVEGVYKLTRISPGNDIICSETEFPDLESITISVEKERK